MWRGARLAGSLREHPKALTEQSVYPTSYVRYYYGEIELVAPRGLLAPLQACMLMARMGQGDMAHFTVEPVLPFN